jgi:hypothetical protein
LKLKASLDKYFTRPYHKKGLVDWLKGKSQYH